MDYPEEIILQDIISHRKDNSNSNIMPFTMLTQDDDNNDGRFHELSITKNFSRFNKSPIPNIY